MQSIQLPLPFVEEMTKTLGADAFQKFRASFDNTIPISIRKHRSKASSLHFEEQVPWCELGFYLHERPIFTLDPTFHSGAYYVQEASSMILWHVFSQLVPNPDSIKVLDLSAAPGGKSTLIASFLHHRGLLVANEIVKNRAYTLKYNLSKEGYSNVIVTNNAPKDFSTLQGFFDVIVVDAPCSGEGMFRKDHNSIHEWSPSAVQYCSSRQQGIIDDVIPALKNGGILIYSTCTYNDSENINNIEKFLEDYTLKCLDIKLPHVWNIEEKQKGQAIGYQFYTHKVKGEGFFFSVMQKDMKNDSIQKWKSSDKFLIDADSSTHRVVEDWVVMENKSLVIDKVGTLHLFPIQWLADAKIIGQFLRVIYLGTTVGVCTKNILIPDHSLALSLDLSVSVTRHELSCQDALLYLKKELHSIDSSKSSWLVATYLGNSLGWLKNLGNRINNYLPAEYRILMALPQNKPSD